MQTKQVICNNDEKKTELEWRWDVKCFSVIPFTKKKIFHILKNENVKSRDVAFFSLLMLFMRRCKESTFSLILNAKYFSVLFSTFFIPRFFSCRSSKNKKKITSIIYIVIAFFVFLLFANKFFPIIMNYYFVTARKQFSGIVEKLKMKFRTWEFLCFLTSKEFSKRDPREKILNYQVFRRASPQAFTSNTFFSLEIFFMFFTLFF